MDNEAFCAARFIRKEIIHGSMKQDHYDLLSTNVVVSILVSAYGHQQCYIEWIHLQ